MKVNITALLMSKMDYIAKNYNVEFGGYLIGEIKDGEIHLQDLLIPNQTVSATSVDISPEAQMDLRRRYKDKVFKILGHFHSHHSMSAFFSATDEENMRNIMLKKKLFVFIVSSDKGHLVRISMRDPLNIDFNDCELYINTIEFNNLRKRLEEIKSGSIETDTAIDIEKVDKKEEDGQVL